MKAYIPFLLGSVLLFAACSGSEKTTENATQEAEPAMSKGKAIFAANCVQCHRLNEKVIGPALAGAMARWDNDTARITAFIHNSQEMIQKGDPRAKKVYAENNQGLMTPMPHLTQDDINELIDYINKGVD